MVVAGHLVAGATAAVALPERAGAWLPLACDLVSPEWVMR